MSSAGYAFTVAVDRGIDPGTWRTRDAVEAAAAPFIETARAMRSEGLGYTSGLSRGGWAVWMVGVLLQHHPLSALTFLTHSGQVTLSDETPTRWTTLLEGRYLERAIAEMRELLGFMRANALRVERLDEIGCIESAELVKQLDSAQVSEAPFIDPEVRYNDEGRSDSYLVVWLKSILAVMETARGRGMAVLHVVDEPM